MANLKSITELPVATSADGVNLIVNDNGYAKQIAAGAVGAQADWNVKDEANPAFVKNKPFYDTREYSEFNLTFDGNITGKEYVNATDAIYLVKISNQPISKEKIIGATIDFYYAGDVHSNTIDSNMLMTDESGSTIYGEGILFSVGQNGFTIGNSISLTTGVWVQCIIVDGSVRRGYVSKISKTTLIGGELQKIEPKYIPEPEYDLDIEIHTSFNETTQEESMDLVVNSANFEGTYEKLKSNIMPKGKLINIDTYITSDGNEQCYKAMLESSQIFAMWDHTTDSLSESADGIMFIFGDMNDGLRTCLNPDNSIDID